MTMELEEIDDFGFSFSDKIETGLTHEEQDNLSKDNEELRDEVIRLRKANREIVKMITKVMNNLKQNPDKPVINWPNRVEKIDEFLNTINDLNNTEKKNDSEEKPTT